MPAPATYAFGDLRTPTFSIREVSIEVLAAGSRGTNGVRLKLPFRDGNDGCDADHRAMFPDVRQAVMVAGDVSQVARAHLERPKGSN